MLMPVADYKTYCKMLDRARDNHFAYPAINVTSLITANAVLKGLAERLERVFPRMVKLYEKKGFIWVMDRVKVTKEGVAEGSGPAAERVERVYSQFVREMKGE